MFTSYLASVLATDGVQGSERFPLYSLSSFGYRLGMAKSDNIIPIERIANRIYVMRGQKVMLDSDLAELYGVQTRVLVQAVKRNSARFPEDFMFQLSKQEHEILKSQTVISSSKDHGGRRSSPYAFTEQGVAMLSSVLKSKRAVLINVTVIRTFVRLRQILATNRDLAKKVQEHDRQIGTLFKTMEALLESPPPRKKNHIGYIRPADSEDD